MKRIVIAMVLTALLAPEVFGQGAAAIRHAREVVNQNNVRQGVPSPAQQPPVATTPRSNTTTQAQSQVALQRDFAGFKPGTLATAAQKQQLTIDLAKAVRGNKPSLPVVKKFVESLSSASSDLTLTGEQQGRLVANIDAVLNSRSLSSAQFDKIIADTQAILQVGSVKRPTAVAIATDLKAIGAEVRR